MLLKDNNNNNGGQRTAGLDERVGSLFQPDTLLGEDYAANFRRKFPLEPERTLLLGPGAGSIARVRRGLL